MPITIKGIRIEDISISRDSDGGGFKIGSATYSLLSSADKVLAKQPIGGYGSMVLEPSPATVKALRDLVASYKQDIVMTLGLDDKETT